MVNDRHDETVLITGASSGIGLELARLFARDGFRLVLTACDPDRLACAGAELGAELTIVQDLRAPDAADRIFDRLNHADVSIDVLVNNAGYARHGPFAETALTDDLGVIGVNAVAFTALIKHALPGMMERGYGRILNVSSGAAFNPAPHLAVYAATKAFELILSESLASELAGTGITVTALCPGTTDTPFVTRSGMDRARAMVDNRMPLADPAEIAVAGYKGMLRGQRLVIPGKVNRLGVYATRFMPRSRFADSLRKALEPVANNSPTTDAGQMGGTCGDDDHARL